MQKNISTDLWLGFIGLGLILCYCFYASIFGADFAKLHISFPSFNFPVFIGEIVMLLCSGISGWLIFRKKVRLTKLQRLFFVYLGFIFLWAGYDYFKVNGSALALRNATLFFYPVFAFFIYSFYSPSFFSKKIVQAFFVVSLIAACRISAVAFFSFIYFILFFAVLCAMAVPKPWKYLLGAAALLLWPYGSILSGARTWLVSSVLAGAFLIFLFVKYFLKIRTAWKLLAGFTAGAVLLGAAFHFADKGGLKTLTTPMKVIQRYQEYKVLIQQREASFHFQKLQIHLYNSGKDNLHNPGPTPPMEVSEQFPQEQNPSHRDVATAYDNILFRLFIWEDMMRELWENKSIFGVGLGHPQRSKSIEILNWAWGEWSSEGWITPHNSFLHLIYRAGVIGVGVICTIFMILYGLIRDFINRRCVTGVLLSGIIIYGLIAANFLLILELPYYAIPFWSIFGLTMAYRRELLKDKK